MPEKSKNNSIITVVGGTAGLIVLFLLVMLLLAACGPAATEPPPPTQDMAMLETQVAQTVVAELTVNAPAATPVPPTAVPPEPTQAPTPVPPPPGPTPDPNLPVAVLPTPTSGQPAVVANYNTTVNSGPGVNYVVYGAFLGGKTALVVGKSEDGLWYAVSVPPAPGGTGWVDAAWVTAANVGSVPVLPTPPVPPSTALVPPGASDPQTVSMVNVYVRNGPGLNFPAYGIAPGGMTARVIGKSEDNQWWAVRLDPAKVGVGFGWVEQAYTYATNVASVPTIKSPEGTTAAAPPPPASSSVPAAMAVDYVNVRSGPSTSYPVYVVAPPGAAAEVTGKNSDGSYLQVKISTTYSPDGLGWVSASYVTTQNTGSVPVVEAAPPPAVPAAPPPSTATGGCTLVSQTPADNTVFAPDTYFETTWVVKNTGSVTWDMNEYDVAYMGAYNGVQIHTGPDRADFTYHVPVGSTYSLTMPMIAPSGTGTYGEMWSVAQGSTTICQFYVYINVQ